MYIVQKEGAESRKIKYNVKIRKTGSGRVKKSKNIQNTGKNGVDIMNTTKTDR